MTLLLLSLLHGSAFLALRTDGDVQALLPAVQAVRPIVHRDFSHPADAGRERVAGRLPSSAGKATWAVITEATPAFTCD